ncbi:hypothetical protein [Marilutibacter maris]|uniref:hypothetical protein n=1 Tax=Marilutibacter maris TaxID=1605891 RepID=UPI0011AE9211|nr:hypothetical protein [Lysobacter maris]
MKFDRVGWFARLLVLLLSPLSAAGEDGFQVSVTITPVSDGYVLGLENNHSEPLTIAPFQLGEASGFLLYAYDPETRELLQAFSVGFPPGGRGGVDEERQGINRVQPAVSLSRRFSKQRIQDHFFRLPKCYFLVLVYRDETDGVLVRSRPSEPVWVCDMAT